MTVSLRARAILGALVIAVLALPATAPAPAFGQADPACPDVVAVDDLATRLAAGPIAGNGLTVDRGTEPQRFEAEVFDILRGALGPDKDLILAELSGLRITGADGEVDAGVWAGMSGSPVYDDAGNLLGAVAYGFSWSPSTLAGITPAEDMLEVLEYRGAQATAAPASVRLDESERRNVAAQTGRAPASVPSTLRQLRVPFVVSGVTQDRIEWLQQEARKARSPLIPMRAGAAAVDAEPLPVSAGGNFAAALSYGDITAAGVGTTTMVCNGRALAFGHPFGWAGETLLSIHGAQAHTVVTDSIFGSYKLASPGAPVGTLRQDRFSAIAGRLGPVPPVTGVGTRTVARRDDDSIFGRDTGHTDVVDQASLPIIAFIQTYADIDFLLDRYYGPGSSKLSWTVALRHKGDTYELARTNRYAASYDLSIESAFELLGQLERLQTTRFGRIHIDDVSVHSDVVEQLRTWRVGGIEVWRDGGWTPPTAVTVAPGDALRVRAHLARRIDDEVTQRTQRVLKVVVPEGARGSRGRLRVGSAGGGGFFDEFCFFFGECGGSGGGASSFKALLRQLRDAPRNDQVQAELTLPQRRDAIVRNDMSQLDLAVTGGKTLRVRVTGRRGGAGREVPEEPRPRR